MSSVPPPVSPAGTDPTAAVLEVGRAAGLAAVGVADASADERTRRILEERRDAGLNADMQFTYRNPARSTDIRRTIPWAESLVVGAWRYPDVVAEAPTVPSARIARYAVADEYGGLRAALGEVAAHLKAAGHRAVVFADDNALVDRAMAHRAGLGWFGRNANLLLPGAGSWFVLGAVVTDAPLRAAEAPVPDGCGPCRRCEVGCPTGAIVAPGVIDARRCLAWLLQAGGPMPAEFRIAAGDRLYGCDDCQEVCPPNRRVAGVGPTGDAPATVEIRWLLTASDEELLERLGRFYLAGRDPRILRRNALVALGNLAATGCPEALELARELLPAFIEAGDDLLAEHATWAARRGGLEAGAGG